jgi:hypothetical protein
MADSTQVVTTRLLVTSVVMVGSEVRDSLVETARLDESQLREAVRVLLPRA